MPYNTSKQLTWAMNSESDLAGYIIYYGTASRTYSLLSTGVGLSGDGSTGIPSKIISGLLDGTTYYFGVTAYDATGNESTFSGEVSTSVSVPKTRVLKQSV
jgi:hypothetical protein